MTGMSMEQLLELALYDRIMRVPTILDHGSPNPALTVGEAAVYARAHLAMVDETMGVRR